MSNIKVKLGDSEFSRAIKEALQETKNLTEAALVKAVDKTAKETVTTIKGKSPVMTGKYRAGWGSKITKQAGRGGYGRTVHNKTRYMLVHLLQNGHGGPHPARAHRHVPSDEEVGTLFEKNMESEMSKG
jgi:hypothetical protein